MNEPTISYWSQGSDYADKVTEIPLKNAEEFEDILRLLTAVKKDEFAVVDALNRFLRIRPVISGASVLP